MPGFPGNAGLVSDPQMTLRADGVFGTHGFGVTLTDLAPDGVVDGRGQLSGAFGACSAADGKLNLCIEAGGGMMGVATVTSTDSSGSLASGRGGGGATSVSYSCSEVALSTSMQMRGLPDMITT